uniref:Uncharacterized protein n=1 Tax=Electrophorus electricus TaxID=8005 RepID=A0A4W4EKF2_ELEEL
MTTERSQKAKQRVVNCSQRGGSGARSNTNGKYLMHFSANENSLLGSLHFPSFVLGSMLSVSVLCSSLAKRRLLSQWEVDLVSRLQTPTISYLARSRSAVCLALIRAPLRQAPPKPEALPPLLEEEDPEPDCLLRPPQHQPHLSAALCLGELVLLKPGPAGPPFSPACPQTALVLCSALVSALSLIGAGTQGGSSAGTTDPERASRKESLARQIAVERVSTEARASQQQEERKRKKEEEQRKAEEEDARRQSEEEGTLRLQVKDEECPPTPKLT